jgi:TatD DNase family protein
VSGFILKDSSDGVRDCFVRACLKEGVIPLDKLMMEMDAPYMGFQGCRQHYPTMNDDSAASLNSKKQKPLQNLVYPNVSSTLPIVLDEVVRLLNEGRMERGEEKWSKVEEVLQREQVTRITTENAIRFSGFDGIQLL